MFSVGDALTMWCSDKMHSTACVCRHKTVAGRVTQGDADTLQCLRCFQRQHRTEANALLTIRLGLADLLMHVLSSLARLDGLVDQAGVSGRVGRLELLDQLELSRVSDDLRVLQCTPLKNISASCRCS